MTLSWKQPRYNGGCPILGFGLHINNGNGGTTFVEIDDTEVRDKPEYTLHTTDTFPATSEGKTF